MTERPAIGRRLASIREKLGLTQADVARRLHLDPSRVNQIERRGDDLRLSTVLRYCDAIGATVHIHLPKQAEEVEP